MRVIAIIGVLLISVSICSAQDDSSDTITKGLDQQQNIKVQEFPHSKWAFGVKAYSLASLPGSLTIERLFGNRHALSLDLTCGYSDDSEGRVRAEAWRVYGGLSYKVGLATVKGGNVYLGLGPYIDATYRYYYYDYIEMNEMSWFDEEVLQGRYKVQAEIGVNHDITIKGHNLRMELSASPFSAGVDVVNSEWRRYSAFSDTTTGNKDKDITYFGETTIKPTVYVSVKYLF